MHDNLLSCLVFLGIAAAGRAGAAIVQRARSASMTTTAALDGSRAKRSLIECDERSYSVAAGVSARVCLQLPMASQNSSRRRRALRVRPRHR
jgi:hypothetical protein